uniref:hypothetical protein n=1 Tax=Ningiella ruwaisensis TaxID=2364274 RepID=UPI00109F0A39|nr:hypothetical protein [Ningiella ruwaisensis]
MQRMIYTGSALPDNLAIVESFNMIQFTGTVEISERGIVVGMFERKRADYQDIINHFAAQAPSDANAIINVQVSSATQAFGDVTYLYLTYIGTPVTLAEC